MTKDEQIVELKERIAELEDELEEYAENDATIHLSDTEKTMLKIISQQIEKLAFISRTDKLDKDEIKGFDSFVKDLVAIRGKMPTQKSSEDKEVQQTEADILKLINGN